MLEVVGNPILKLVFGVANIAIHTRPKFSRSNDDKLADRCRIPGLRPPGTRCPKGTIVQCVPK